MQNPHEKTMKLISKWRYLLTRQNMRYVTGKTGPDKIDPVKLAYISYQVTVSGEDKKPPIIIMHGLLGSKQNWNSVSKAIHRKTLRKVITVDARNHGESPHSSQHSYFHLAEDIKFLLESLGIKTASILGHSMGGRAMMLLALKYPNLISSVIIADISPLTVSPSLNDMSKYFAVMRDVKINDKLTIAQARKLADDQLSKLITDKSLRDFIVTNLVKEEKGYKWRVNIDALDKNFENNIAQFPGSLEGLQFRGPVLFVAGGNSDYIRKSDETEIRKYFPSSKIAIIEGAGHWVHADKPAEFLHTVIKFLNES